MHQIVVHSAHAVNAIEWSSIQIIVRFVADSREVKACLRKECNPATSSKGMTAPVNAVTRINGTCFFQVLDNLIL